MKTTLWLLLLGSVVLAQTPPPAPAPITYDEAVANEKKLFAADQQHDMETVKALVADDFVDIARDGSSIGKQALLEEIPKIKLLKYAQQNFRVTALGPFSYAISYDSDATMIGADGKEVRSENPLNTVWIKRDGRWQILLHSRGAAQPLAAR
ncbi:MAG TPA: nuclear transport factor 2 family protein [Vicinamibacterales bacterium]|jgi:hypothetical protein|nr:nuclear transport factor 2 family protein [Vicinamibacterales bacterium]